VRLSRENSILKAAFLGDGRWRQQQPHSMPTAQEQMAMVGAAAVPLATNPAGPPSDPSRAVAGFIGRAPATLLLHQGVGSDAASCPAAALTIAQSLPSPSLPLPLMLPASHRGSEASSSSAVVASAAAAPKGGDLLPGNGHKTSVMLRNLPNNYSRAMVLKMIDDEGFLGTYNFVYFPIDFRSRAGLGYAFVNFEDPAMVVRFWRTFEGFSNWMLPSKKSCFVSWCAPHQGLEAHVERYRNSPVMHPSVPDEYKPLVFSGGARVPFPAPTKAVRAPRLRN